MFYPLSLYSYVLCNSKQYINQFEVCIVSDMELLYLVQAVCCGWLVSAWILNKGLLLGNFGGVRICTVVLLI